MYHRVTRVHERRSQEDRGLVLLRTGWYQRKRKREGEKGGEGRRKERRRIVCRAQRVQCVYHIWNKLRLTYVLAGRASWIYTLGRLSVYSRCNRAFSARFMALIDRRSDHDMYEICIFIGDVESRARNFDYVDFSFCTILERCLKKCFDQRYRDSFIAPLPPDCRALILDIDWHFSWYRFCFLIIVILWILILTILRSIPCICNVVFLQIISQISGSILRK